MKQPKLLFLVTEDWYFVSHRLPLARAALLAGYDVAVATRVNRHGDIIRNAGVTLLDLEFDRASLNPLREAALIARISRIYDTVQPDIVHHVALKPVVYGSIAAARSGVPAVVNALTGLGFVFASDSTKARLLRPFVRQALASLLPRRNTHTIVQNEDDKALLIRERLAPANQVHLIRGSGVDVGAFAQSPLPSGRPRVVLPARLLKDKGVIEFIEAVRLCKSRGVDAEFVLAGSPDPLNPTSIAQTQIDSWVNEGLVTYLGWRDDMAQVLASATIVCLPSYREGLPKSLLEAAAIGRPIIATDVAGCREIVVDGENGWLVPPRDPVKLAAALVDALGNRDRLESFGRRSRRLVEDDLSTVHVAEKTLKLYELMRHDNRESKQPGQ